MMSEWQAADGARINYETFGDADRPATLLMLPGLLGSISVQWRNFIRPLSPHFRLILMDLRGHGRSTNPGSALEPEQMAQDILGLLDHLSVQTCHIAGYDFGGYLGLLLTFNASRRVETLLMHGSKFYWTKEAAASVRSQLDPNHLAEKAPAYADSLVKEHGARNWRELLRQAGDLTAGLVTKGIKERNLTNLSTPVLVSVGDRDELVPVIEAHRLSHILPKGELIVLPG
ncbi:MAG: alpha/beta fold hydrolase, partial [Anaerolineae bacterium]